MLNIGEREDKIMLFKVSKLKPILKHAWKNTGLVVGAAEEDGDISFYYFAGKDWIIAVYSDGITKELKGALIELVGDLPSAGEEFISYRGNNQQQVGFEEHFAIWDKYHEAYNKGQTYQAHNTSLVINDEETPEDLRVYTCEDGTVMTVLEKISKIIDTSECAEGELVDAEQIKVKDAEMEMLMWISDSCYVAAVNSDPTEGSRADGYLQRLKKALKAE